MQEPVANSCTLLGPGSRQGKGACEKPSPRRCASPAPRSGLLFLLEGESVPPRATYAHLSLLASPCPGTVLGGCPSWRTHFSSKALPFHTAPCWDGGDTVAGSRSASGSHPCSFRMGFSWCKPAVASCGVQSPAVSSLSPQLCPRVPSPLGKGSPGSSQPSQPLQMGVRFGVGRGSTSRGPSGRSGPQGERGKGSSPMPPGCLAQCRVRTRGAPVSLYNVAVPAPCRDPRGPAGRAPGADVTLGWQRGEGLGPAAEGAGASPSSPRRAAPSDSPVQLLGCIFSLRQTHGGC